jgi:hypothetical protein
MSHGRIVCGLVRCRLRNCWSRRGLAGARARSVCCPPERMTVPCGDGTAQIVVICDPWYDLREEPMRDDAREPLYAIGRPVQH